MHLSLVRGPVSISQSHSASKRGGRSDLHSEQRYFPTRKSTYFVIVHAHTLPLPDSPELSYIGRVHPCLGGRFGELQELLRRIETHGSFFSRPEAAAAAGLRSRPECASSQAGCEIWGVVWGSFVLGAIG